MENSKIQQTTDVAKGKKKKFQQQQPESFGEEEELRFEEVDPKAAASLKQNDNVDSVSTDSFRLITVNGVDYYLFDKKHILSPSNRMKFEIEGRQFDSIVQYNAYKKALYANFDKVDAILKMNPFMASRTAQSLQVYNKSAWMAREKCNYFTAANRLFQTNKQWSDVLLKETAGRKIVYVDTYERPLSSGYSFADDLKLSANEQMCENGVANFYGQYLTRIRDHHLSGSGDDGDDDVDVTPKKKKKIAKK